MGTSTILVPYNFTAIDQKAIEFITKTFGPRKETKITLFHIYIQLPQIETASSTVMGRLSSSMHYLSRDLKEKEATLRNAREIILEKGFAEHQVNYIFRPRSKSVAEEIIETAAVDMTSLCSAIDPTGSPEHLSKAYTTRSSPLYGM